MNMLLDSGGSKTDERRLYRFGSSDYDLASRPFIMGILNVTPDSFSDGGRFEDVERAVERGCAMAEEGADFIDVGGESTRPGAQAVPEEEERRRVMPVIRRLAARVSVPISIDTYKARIAAEALDAGAVIVNDITGMTFDGAMARTVADHRASVVLMHMQGTPRSMQERPHYDDVVGEVRTFLLRQAEAARQAGITQILIDPGIGFGKTLDHNLELLRHLTAFTETGYPVLVGPSRKSFLGKLLDLPVDERLEGTAAAVAACVLQGAAILRVHDVRAMKRVAIVAHALRRR